jgi:hypothetical protein
MGEELEKRGQLTIVGQGLVDQGVGDENGGKLPRLTFIHDDTDIACAPRELLNEALKIPGPVIGSLPEPDGERPGQLFSPLPNLIC